MKKLILTSVGIIFCVVMSSAQNNNNQQQKHLNPNSSKVLKAIETGDVSGLDEIMDKDIIDHRGGKGDVIGIDSVKKLFTDLHDHIDNLHLESIADATDGDYHFNLNRMTGTTNSEFMGMPANTKIDITAVQVVRLKNGKSVEHWTFNQPADVMKMMQGNKMESASAANAPK